MISMKNNGKLDKRMIHNISSTYLKVISRISSADDRKS